MAFLVTNPMRRMMPIMVMTLKGLRKIAMAPKAPTMDRGNESMMVKGCRKLSNCAASTRYTMITASSSAVIRLPNDSRMMSAMPDQPVFRVGGISFFAAASIWVVASPRARSFRFAYTVI